MVTRSETKYLQCLDNIKRLTGRAASPDDIKQLTYMAYRFSRKIQAVDTVRKYKFAHSFFFFLKKSWNRKSHAYAH